MLAQDAVDLGRNALVVALMIGAPVLVVGMVVLFRGGDLLEQTEDEHNYVTVLKPRDGELEYYFGAAWEQEPNGVADEAADEIEAGVRLFEPVALYDLVTRAVKYGLLFIARSLRRSNFFGVSALLRRAILVGVVIGIVAVFVWIHREWEATLPEHL